MKSQQDILFTDSKPVQDIDKYDKICKVEPFDRALSTLQVRMGFAECHQVVRLIDLGSHVSRG
jgi:hypothetical protein